MKDGSETTCWQHSKTFQVSDNMERSEPFSDLFREFFCRSLDVLQLKPPQEIVQYVVRESPSERKNGGISIVMCQMLGLQMVSAGEHVRC